MLRTLVDALFFSSLSVAATAATLTAAASYALGAAPNGAVLGLAAAGALVVYNVDRLRDRERDQLTCPDRTRFVERWRSQLTGLVVLALGVAAALAWQLGPRVAWLLAPAALLGLAHRRLKRLPYSKGPYVAAAWVGIVVGLPALLADAPRNTAWTALLLFATCLANVMASNARDGEAAAARFGAARVLGWARGLAGVATLAAAFAPSEVRNLLPIAGLTWLALLGFRQGERYGLIVLDGALLVGAAIACALAQSL